MKKIICLFVLIIVSCHAPKSISTSVKESEITFNILAVNDVYEIAALDNGRVGGMARVAFLRDSLKAINPNTFLTMAGDFLNPSLVGTLKIEDERISGKQMIEVMNAMNFDLVTYGNHEFDLSLNDFQKRLNESTFNWVSANVSYKGEDIIAPFSKTVSGKTTAIPKTETLTITDYNGNTVKVGFVSVTTGSNPRDWVDYGNYLNDAQSAYYSIKDSVDIAIGFTHLNLEDDKLIAKNIPQLPLIIGGHEHDALDVTVGNTKIRKADANAKSAYIHQFKYNTKTKDLNLTSTLVPVYSKTPHQKDIKKIIDKWTAIQDQEIGKIIENPYDVIYHSKEVLDGTDAGGRNMQTNLGKLVAKSMRYAYNNEIDAVFVNSGSFRIDDELHGDISSYDMFRVLPFGGNLLKVKLKGRLLIEVLNYGEQSAGTGAYLQRLNLEKDTKSGQWLIQQNAIKADQDYWIITTGFLLKGYDIPMLVETNPDVLEIVKPEPNSVANDMRKTVITYFKIL